VRCGSGINGQHVYMLKEDVTVRVGVVPSIFFFIQSPVRKSQVYKFMGKLPVPCEMSNSKKVCNPSLVPICSHKKAGGTLPYESVNLGLKD
jgi:hypothetical protein